MEVIASKWKPTSTFCTWILNKVRSDSVNLYSYKRILSSFHWNDSFDVKICAPEINLRTGSELTLAKLRHTQRAFPCGRGTCRRTVSSGHTLSITNLWFHQLTKFMFSSINEIHVYLLWLSWRWIRHTQRALPYGRETRRRTVSSARTLGGSRCQSLLAQWNLRC